jgi:signal transduction histidine kinase/CheY-like chemotaxis protein
MWELAAAAQREVDENSSQAPVFKILETIYPEATITLQPSRDAQIDIEGQGSLPLSDFENGLWEDIDYIDDFIAKSNQREPPSTKVVRVLASPCESISGPSFLVISSRDFRLIFDDIDLWFVQLCATMISQLWHKLLLEEAMVAKEKFLRGFSHQLRTPIHGILGSVELLAEVLKPKLPSGNTHPLSDAEEKVRAAEPSLYLDTIKTAGRDLISIVNSMITLNRWADIAMADRCYAVHTVHDLETELGDEIHKMLVEDPRYRSSIFFESMNDVPFKIDIGLLRDCLLPLVINAIQNTHDGMIKVKLTAHTDAKELVVDIEDNGRGIHPEDYQRIFEPYEKVDVHSGGAGLGLTLASKFATLLHGSITLESSSIGRGSHFRATFRKVEFSQTEISPPPPKPQSLPLQFYVKEPSSEDLSLHNCFSNFLIRNGYTCSDQKEDCCVTLLDHLADLKHGDTSQVPPGKVGVCLIPTTEKESCFEQASNDIIFLTSPFFTSKMHSTLEEINRRLERLETLPEDPPQASAPPPDQPQLEEGLIEKELPAHPKPSAIPIPESAEPAPEPEPAPVAPEVLPSPIPIAETREADLVSAPIPARAPKPTTLLVDDNAINLRIMQMYCTKRGLPYLCAKDGREAVQAYSKHQADAAEGKVSPIELIFMDLQMPVCDGIEATQTIRQLEKEKQWAESTVFIVTGQDSPADRTAADGAGAHEYYVKPVSVAKLDLGVVRYFPAFKAK